MAGSPKHAETHLSYRSGWLRAAVLGANDGILSVASVVLGVAAAGASRTAVATAGVAALSAGAMSMAAGELVSVSSQRDTENADLALEERELATDPEAELRELSEIYVGRGLSPELAAAGRPRLRGCLLLRRDPASHRGDRAQQVGADPDLPGRRGRDARPARRPRRASGRGAPSARHREGDRLGAGGNGCHRRRRRHRRHGDRLSGRVAPRTDRAAGWIAAAPAHTLAKGEVQVRGAG